MHMIGEWNVISFLIVPAIVIDNMGAFKSINRSKKMFRSVWGKCLSTYISFGWLACALIFPALIIGLIFGILLVWDIVPLALSASVVGILAVWIVGVIVILTAINAAFEAILHLYVMNCIWNSYSTSWHNLTSLAPNLTPEVLQQCFIPADSSS